MLASSARARVRSGELRGAELRACILSVPAVERDRWVDEALGLPPMPDDFELPREGVPYLPSGVDAIVAAIDGVGLSAEDHFVDLGAGLGKVVLLAHLLTGAHASGIEVQPHLVAHARRSAEALALEAVSFVCANAAEQPLSGTVFYLYAPFGGATRARVLDELRACARSHPLRVCALGFDLRGETWLAPLPCADVELALYRSR